MNMLRALCLTAVVAAPIGAAAHPHVFVETGLRIDIDAAGMVQGVEVRWTYDELFTMLTFEDRGLDSDYDGTLNPQEIAFLTGFDLNWIEGFEGDLYVSSASEQIALGAPVGRGLSVDGAKITSVHYRPLAQPVQADGLLLMAFDPTYYTAYDLTGGAAIEGPCAANVSPPDLDAAYSRLEELLYATPTSVAEDRFPEVGEIFAARVRLTCSD